MTPRWMLLFALVGCDSLDDDYSDPPPETPIAHDDVVTVMEDATNGFTKASLLANDEGADDVTSFKASQPLHGSWVTTTMNYQSAQLYVPDPGYHGPDQITYEIENRLGEKSSATVTIDVVSDGIRFEHSTMLDDRGAAGVAVGDINGDLLLDVIVVTPGSSNFAVLANRTTTPGQFAAEAFRFEGGHTPVGLAVVDFDGDGRLDVVTAAGTDGLIVLRNITSVGGPIAFAAPISLPTGTAVAVAALDLNGDGAADLAALDSAGRALQVRINTSTVGAISFGVRTSFTTPEGPSQLLASDVDGDGAQDLAVLARTAGSLSLFVNATVVGDVVPAFAARVDRATGQSPASMFLADLDGDARDELAVLHGNNALWIYANRTMGGAPMYEAARVLDIDTTSATNATIAAPIDLDGQGPTDILVAVAGNYPFAQLVNGSAQPGSYVFDARDSQVADVLARKRATFQIPTGMVRADLDGAGAPEIILTTRTGYTDNGGTFVLFDR